MRVLSVVPARSGRRGFPFKGERRLGKHVRKGEVEFRVLTFTLGKEEQLPQKERGSITKSLTTFNTHYIILFEVKTCTT